MGPRELFACFHMPQSPSLDSLYNISIPILGASALFCAIITYAIAKMFGFWSRKNEFNVEGQVRAKLTMTIGFIFSDRVFQTVVITGGSDGMGKAVALQLAEKGANVIVVARTISKLMATVDDLKVRKTYMIK